MSFDRFLHSGLLMDEATGDPAGGGTPATPAPAAPAAFDPASFKAEIMGELSKGLNAFDRRQKGLDGTVNSFMKDFGSFKSELLTMLRPADPAPTGDPDTAPAAVPAPAATTAPVTTAATAPTGLAKPSPEVIRLQKQVQEMADRETKRNEEMALKEANLAKKELSSALKGEIGLYQFAATSGQSDLFSLLLPNVVRGDDGQYYGPEGIPLADYVKTEYGNRPTWQPAVKANGTGAPAPSIVNGRLAVDDSIIKPGMSADDKSRVNAAIIQALTSKS